MNERLLVMQYPAMFFMAGCRESGLVSDENTPAVIEGSSVECVLENESYAFTPTATDADGDTIHFNIGNLPSWRTFDEPTGQVVSQYAVYASEFDENSQNQPINCTITPSLNLINGIQLSAYTRVVGNAIPPGWDASGLTQGLLICIIYTLHHLCLWAIKSNEQDITEFNPT
jgi:hypothetical protein